MVTPRPGSGPPQYTRYLHRTTPESESSSGCDTEIQFIPQAALETFADLGGLEHVKDLLRSSIGAILDGPDHEARYRVLPNGILLHGPCGNGKTLLSRALAGEYRLGYLRFSPATVASGDVQETAKNLRRLFELARENSPCVLFLDEIDTIASEYSYQPSRGNREVVTQLMACLEECRAVPGLVIVAATEEVRRLGPALRDGQFDATILVPLPDMDARKDIFRVHLSRRAHEVAWACLDYDELAQQTNGYNAAAIQAIVTASAQAALRSGARIGQTELIQAIAERGGHDCAVLAEEVTWDQVVVQDETRQQLMEVLAVFAQPDLAVELGVSLPAGVILHGPPGTGKTTIAKAMASQIRASYYELSAADLMSKRAGEPERQVARLFARAKANRPSIVFIDEIDSLLRRRRTDSSSGWEKRVISRFLCELDGLSGGDSVLLVGATTRPDVMGKEIVGRRLMLIEVGLPDAIGRLKLLRLLCHDMTLAEDVSLREIASMAEGFSGSDLGQLCKTAGMKALTRVATARITSDGCAPTKPQVTVTTNDLLSSLECMRDHASLVEV